MKIKFIVMTTLFIYTMNCLSTEESWKLDSRFARLDIKQMIIAEYPNLSSKAETISHYSGYYNISPFLLAEELTNLVDPNIIQKSKEIHTQLTTNKIKYLEENKHLEKVKLLMLKYGITSKTSTKVNEELPVLDLPFDFAFGWLFNGVHTWTGENDDTPMSSIDLTRSWGLNWGSNTDNDWVAATHDGIASVFSSCYVRVTHSSGWATDYYHLDNVQINNGDEVYAGQRISNYANNFSQATCQGGSSTGPHLHFSLLKNGIRQNLHEVELSLWRIHPGTSSYDRDRLRMWLIKDTNKIYAYQLPATHLNGDNIIDYRYSGIYSNSEMSGHGINILLTRLEGTRPEESRNVVFVTFYTYDNAGNANFYAGNVDYDNWRIDETKTVNMFQTSGGNFDDLQSIDFENDVVDAGSINIQFNSCSEVEIGFSLIEPLTQQIVEKEIILSKTIGLPDSVCNSPSQLTQ